MTAGKETVIVWHVGEGKALQVLKHNDLVCSAVFRQSFRADRSLHIASGGCEKMLRIWNITTGKVTDWQKTSHYITSLAFSGTGHRLVAGLISGEICVYDSEKEKLSFVQKIECNNRTGKFAKGTKVTGIEFMGVNHPNCIMVTTNDSRIRFVNINKGVI